MANIGGKGEQNVSRVMGSTKEDIKPFFSSFSSAVFCFSWWVCGSSFLCIEEIFQKAPTYIILQRQ